MTSEIRTNIDSREGYSLEEQLAYEAYLADGGDVTNEDYEEMCDYFDSLEDEYDGQPDEYTEWQDYMGGDDWDQGQYDEY